MEKLTAMLVSLIVLELNKLVRGLVKSPVSALMTTHLCAELMEKLIAINVSLIVLV